MCCFFLICDQKKKVTDATASETRSVSLSRSWISRLRDEFELEYMKELRIFLIEQKQQGKKIYPPGKQIFNALNSTSFETTNVVILGQDPYPTKGHANGLSFSVNDDVNPLPKSLKNIFKELADDLNKPERICGNLNDWAKQGVLLLNTTLTVREGEVESHINKGWEILTNSVISALHKKNNIVYIKLSQKNLILFMAFLRFFIEVA